MPTQLHNNKDTTLYRSQSLLVLFVTSLLVFACTTTPKAIHSGKGVTLYTNAMVWSEDQFVARDFATKNGLFTTIDIVGPESMRHDLDGLYVIPPLANAHHHITSASSGGSNAFLQEGIYYVWNPNSMATVVSAETTEFFARPDTFDVRQALGGITEPGGHPEKLYVDVLSKWVYKGKEKSFFVKNAFHYGRNEKEIYSALDRLVEQGAEFIKIYLLYSEEYQERRDDDRYYGLKGMNPDNVETLVAAAHERGLVVAAHLETAYDFRVAVAAGVDMLAHLPAYSSEKSLEGYSQKTLTRSDALDAVRSGVVVVPTYALARSKYKRRADNGEPAETSLIAAHYATQASNLRLLLDAGVPVLTGTDSDIGVIGELEHAVDIGAMTMPEALQSALGTGARLFPQRKLGRIENGYEADFIVLSASPAVDLAALGLIELRVKAGAELVLPETPAP